MIKLDHVTCGYEKDILKNINLAISKDKITFVIGKNGSGKSTLASILTGLKTDFKGDIYIEMTEIKKKVSIKEMRNLIGMVFQNPNNQLIFSRVYDDMKFALENVGIPKEKMEKRILEALELVDMKEYIDANPYELSGGQKQRLAIASVLALQPKYIVFDEATSMLDINGKKDIYKIYEKLKKENIGVICITNILDELIYADEIMILGDTGIYQYSKVELFQDLSILTRHGLEIPFLLQVVEKLNQKGIHVYQEADILRELESL